MNRDLLFPSGNLGIHRFREGSDKTVRLNHDATVNFPNLDSKFEERLNSNKYLFVSENLEAFSHCEIISVNQDNAPDSYEAISLQSQEISKHLFSPLQCDQFAFHAS
jgi:hypothetical protein